MKLNAEVLAGMEKMNLYKNRRVSHLDLQKSGIITEWGFFDANTPYVGIEFDDGSFERYDAKDYGKIYVEDTKPKRTPSTFRKSIDK